MTICKSYPFPHDFSTRTYLIDFLLQCSYLYDKYLSQELLFV